MTVSIFPLSLLSGMLNLTTVLHDLMISRYSSGMPVFEAALSKNNLTCSKNLGSWNSSVLGPKFYGSKGFLVCAAEKLNCSKRQG